MPLPNNLVSDKPEVPAADAAKELFETTEKGPEGPRPSRVRIRRPSTETKTVETISTRTRTVFTDQAKARFRLLYTFGSIVITVAVYMAGEPNLAAGLVGALLLGLSFVTLHID